jgi:hypothetical protein
LDVLIFNEFKNWVILCLILVDVDDRESWGTDGGDGFDAWRVCG